MKGVPHCWNLPAEGWSSFHIPLHYLWSSWSASIFSLFHSLPQPLMRLLWHDDVSSQHISLFLLIQLERLFWKGRSSTFPQMGEVKIIVLSYVHQRISTSACQAGQKLCVLPDVDWNDNTVTIRHNRKTGRLESPPSSLLLRRLGIIIGVLPRRLSKRMVACPSSSPQNKLLWICYST